MIRESIIKENGLNMEEIEVSEEGMYFLDADRKIFYWNPAAEAITGYPSEDMLGKHCYESGLHHVDELGRAMCRSLCPMAATIFDGKSRGQKVSVHCSDGKRRWLMVSTRPLLENGEICGAIEFFHLARPDELLDEAIAIEHDAAVRSQGDSWK